MIKLNIKNDDSFIKRTFVIVPEIISSLYNEEIDCFKKISNIAKMFAPDFKILRMNIFVESQNISEFIDIRNQFIENFLKNSDLSYDINDFPIVFIAQPPTNKRNISIEFTAILLPALEYKYEIVNYNNGSYNRLSIGDDVEIYGCVSDISTGNSNVFSQASNCFEFINEILENNKMDFGNIVRQWAYIGNLNSYNTLNNSEIENYQMFNLSRVKYYKKSNWKYGFPSATGIGANINGCTMEFIASNEINDKLIIPLHNPRQLDAHKYSEKFQVEFGKENNDLIVNKTENTPKFERGKVVITNNSMDIYISGTAAILGEDSIYGDIYEQTKTTLENISRLSSIENLLEHGIEIVNELPKFSSARVYIKYQQDSDIVEEICSKFFGETPVIYVIADVCRKELLVEIEAYINCRIERK